MTARGRPRGSRNIDWEAIVARLRRHPDTWLIPSQLTAVSDRTITTIRRRERRALRLDDGIIRCRRKATAWLEDGTVMVTLAVKFEPTKPKENHGR